MPETLSLAQIMGGNAAPPSQPQTLSLAQIMGGHAAPAPQPDNAPPVAGAGAAAYFQQYPSMDPLAVEQAFQQLPAATEANQYLAAHAGMDPTAVHTAFGVGPEKGTTSLETQRQIDEQNRAAQGVAGNAGAGALSNYTGLGGQVEEGFGHVAGALGMDQTAENYKLAAERTFGTAPQNGSFAGTVGKIAGNPMNYLGKANAGPAGQLAAGMSALNEMGMSAHNIDVDRQNGQFVGTGQALTNIGAHGLLDYVANRVAQKGITGDFCGAMAPVLKNVIARVAARYATTGAVEGLAGAGNQLLNNAIEKITGINPNVDLTDGVWHAALQQAGLGTAGQAVHEAINYKGQPQPQNLNDRNSFLGKMRIQHAAKLAVEAENAKRAPTIQPPSGQEPSIRVQGEEHLIQPEAYDASRKVDEQTFGPGSYDTTPGAWQGRATNAKPMNLPDAPANIDQMSNDEIRQWMTNNGYEAPANGFRGHLIDEIGRQQVEKSASASPVLPQGIEGWDAGKLRTFARDNGINLESVEAEAAQGNPRKVLLEATACRRWPMRGRRDWRKSSRILFATGSWLCTTWTNTSRPSKAASRCKPKGC